MVIISGNTLVCSRKMNCQYWLLLVLCPDAAAPGVAKMSLPFLAFFWFGTWMTNLMHKIITCEKWFKNSYFWKIANFTRNFSKMSFFFSPGDLEGAISLKITRKKTNSQGVIFVIISSQRVRIQYTYTYVNISEHHRFLIRCTYLTLFCIHSSCNRYDYTYVKNVLG